MSTEAEPDFIPFADEAAVAIVGGLSFENGTTRIAVHGSLDLGRDRPGLARARRIKALVDAIVTALEAQDVADRVADEPQAAKPVTNPFA